MTDDAEIPPTLPPPSVDMDDISTGSPSRGWLSSVRRPRTSPGPRASALKRTLLSDDDDRRDSALATSSCNVSNEPSSPTSLRKTPSLPAIVVQEERSPTSRGYASRHSHETEHEHERADRLVSLDTVIPTGSFDDLTSDTLISFSRRGSMLLGGKKANRASKRMSIRTENMPIQTAAPPVQEEQSETDTRQEPLATSAPSEPSLPSEPAAPSAPSEPSTLPAPSQPSALSVPSAPAAPPAASNNHLTPRPPSRFSARGRATSQRVLSADEMILSRKVRAMYMHGNESAVNWDVPERETCSLRNSFKETTVNSSSLTVDGNPEDSSSFVSSRHESVISKEPTETAGGLEDWANLEGGEVDRYGFIIPKKSRSGDGDGAGGEGLEPPDQPTIQRVSTSLQLMSETPRRRKMGRSASRPRSSGSPSQRGVDKSKASKSVFSNQTSHTRNTQRSLRHATNALPHNKTRRLRDEASDMLKLPPGLAEVAEQKEGGRAAQALRTKEIARDDKWRKMAKVVKSGADKGGMLFEFDTKDPKLVSRVWKGIPDRWRATAWYSFLAASAKSDPDSPSEEELVDAFYELQAESSVEDVQIDVDVPRTINRHIMFRRRYRGGQRLLFRVLHAMSLYLPDTGYVQGMAALAATLLCYYEEDRAFVMLVRLWMLRGMERLYEAGFAGLMEALDDFEQNWLCEGDVAKKLIELGITSTAYGTRWYLTLFNYSLPFPAQLRVWDVFMLLGDRSYSNSPNSNFSGDLDVLHATSAALIDATREILLDSDFENAMKVLTSWIPIKDEELLMRVAKAEYRMRKKRAKE